MTRVRITPNTRYIFRIICHLIIITSLIFAGSKAKKGKARELEYKERRKNTKSFVEMAREEKEAKQREQEQDTNPK